MPALQPVYVISNNIDCVAHDQRTLFVRFKSGETYSYDGVPYDHFDALQKVESAGKFFSSSHPRQISLHEVVARPLSGGTSSMNAVRHKAPPRGFVFPA